MTDQATPIKPERLWIQGLRETERPLAYLAGVFAGATNGMTYEECRAGADVLQEILSERLVQVSRGERSSSE